MITTDTYWDVDGFPLQTFAFNITTLGGERMAPPPVRGSNVTLPFAPGQQWVSKVPDQRSMTLGMWVTGANKDGSIPQDEDARRIFDRNWSMLRRLLWRPRQQFTLGKRFWIPVQDLVDANALDLAITIQGNFALIYAEAKAEFSGGLAPTMGGPARGAFTVDLTLADPFFYSAEQTITVTTAQPTNTFVLGDDRSYRVNVEMHGALTTPKLTMLNQTTPTWVQTNHALAAGVVETIDVRNFKASQVASGVTTPTTGYIKNSGDNFWFYAQPGAASFGLTAGAVGTGNALIKYRAAWH